MMRFMMKSKIHRATVTQADLDYVGSIGIDRDLMEAADLLEGEKVTIADITNGARLETYVIPAPRGSGIITINGAAAHLVGRHDFTTFRSAQCQSDSPVKTLDKLDVTTVGEEIHVTAAARSFLHHQVRSMVGCLALIGRGQWSPDDMAKALEAKDRAALGFNAPPHGLYFVEAIYP